LDVDYEDDYEDKESLNNLDITNTMRCGKQMLKIMRYKRYLKYSMVGSQRQKKLYQFEKNKVRFFFLNMF